MFKGLAVKSALHVCAESILTDFQSASVLVPRRSVVAGAATVFAVAVLLLALAWVLDGAEIALAAMAFVSTVIAIGISRYAKRVRRRTSSGNKLNYFRELVEDDLSPAFVSDALGRVVWSNRVGRELNEGASVELTDPDSLTVAEALRGFVPNARGVISRLLDEARVAGHANERLAGVGRDVAVRVRRLPDAFVWRLETFENPEAIAPNGVPTLTVGRNQTVLHMNEAAKQLIGKRIISLETLPSGGPLLVGASNSILTSRGRVTVFVSEQRLKAGRSHVELHPVSAQDTLTDVALTDFPVPLMRLSKQGKVIQINQMARNLLQNADIVGRDLEEVFESLGNKIGDWLTEADQSSTPTVSEFLKVRDCDKETFVQVVLKRASSGDEMEFVAVLADATKLKSLEAQFVQSQKMQAIGQLAGGVAHDFNNLLTAISGHCDLLLLRHDQGDQDYADLMQIHQNANRAAALVSQLLAFSRKQTLQPETLDLRETLSDLTHLLNRLVGEKVSLILSHDPVLKPVRADKRQLEQVIMNLVVNARDAMPDGGQITVETEGLTLDAPLSRDRVTVPVGDYVVVRVRDEGTGISKDAISKVFEPFYTTKRTGEGTGLGLSTAYGIVKQTGGFIFADSEVGQGTSFTLLFPAADVPVEQAQATEQAQPRPGLGTCDGVVLLVEDEAPVRAFASRALRMQGFDVIEADCAEKALELLADSRLQVDVFVTDVVMPGMDGPTWVTKALQDRPDVRIVFVSGYAEGALGGDRPVIPNSVFLPKPFSLTDLTATVQQQLH